MEGKMKKGCFNIMLAAILSLAIAGTSYAFKFDFHGKMWQAVGVTDNYAGAMDGPQKSGPTDYFSYNGGLNTKGITTSKMYSVMSENDHALFGLTKARLRFEGTTDDGLAKIVYGLEVGTVNWGDNRAGKDFDLSGDGINQETRFAYAEVVMPGIGGKVRAGLQPTDINHWVWTETAAGLTYHRDFGAWKTMAGWYRGEDNTTSGIEGDNNYFVIKADNKLTKSTTLGFFGIYTELETDETSQGDCYDGEYYYLGLTGKYSQGSLFGNFDFIYQGGDIDLDDSAIDDLDRSAWLGNLTVGFKVSDKFKISGNILYVTGDDDPNDGDAENFDAIDVDVKIGTIFFKDSIMADCDRFISDAPYILDKGLINYAIQAEYQISEKNNLRAAVRYLMTAEDLEVNNESDDDLGYEIDLWYTYKLNKHVDLKIDAAYLFAGDGADLLAASDHYDSDDMYKLAAGIKISF
jgi:predicted porin